MAFLSHPCYSDPVKNFTCYFFFFFLILKATNKATKHFNPKEVSIMAKRIPLDIREREDFKDTDYIAVCRELFPGKFPQIVNITDKNWTYEADIEAVEKIKDAGQWETLRQMVAEKALWVPGIVDGCNMAGEPYSVMFPVGRAPGANDLLSDENPSIHAFRGKTDLRDNMPCMAYVQLNKTLPGGYSLEAHSDKGIAMMASKCYALAFPNRLLDEVRVFFQQKLENDDDVTKWWVKRQKRDYIYPMKCAATPEEAEAMLIGMQLVGCQEMRVCDLCQFAQDYPGGELDDTGILMKDRKAMQEIISRYDEDAVVDAGIAQISKICKSMVEENSQSVGMKM